jgi:acetyltransferase-like isoleucine patch superfamily enzyme
VFEAASRLAMEKGRSSWQFDFALPALSGIEAPMPKRSWTEYVGGVLSFGRNSLSRFWALEARLKGVSLGPGVAFVGRPLISVAKGSRLALGKNVRIHSSLRANPLGCFQPSVLRTLCPEAELVLEANAGISGCVLCAARSIRIGEGTIIGSGALVMDTDLHRPAGQWEWSRDYETGARSIQIGRGVFIGARAIVLKGVAIGDRAVVGAGAVVTKVVPPRHFAVGNPARIIPIPDGYFAPQPGGRRPDQPEAAGLSSFAPGWTRDADFADVIKAWLLPKRIFPLQFASLWIMPRHFWNRW